MYTLFGISVLVLIFIIIILTTNSDNTKIGISFSFFLIGIGTLIAGIFRNSPMVFIGSILIALSVISVLIWVNSCGSIYDSIVEFLEEKKQQKK